MKMRSNGALALGGEPRQGVECPPETKLDEVGETGAGDVGAGDRDVLRVGLERDQPATGGERTREPDRAVAAQRADLEDSPRTLDPCQEHQELALAGRDVVRRQLRLGIRPDGCIQGRIGLHEKICDVAVDRGPLLLIHGFSPRRRTPLIQRSSRERHRRRERSKA